MPPTYADVLDAAERLKGQAVRTPLIESPALNERIGGRVLLKAETLQISGSFKFRGAYNRISRLSEDEKRRGVVAFSSGNHAQGVAAAAKRVGCPAVIVMPADSPRVKMEGVRAFGGEIRAYDRWTESREAIGAELARERGAVLVPPFDDPFVIAGQGTSGLEIIEDAEALGLPIDRLLCGASGGGLLAGLNLVLAERSPDTRVFVIEPAAFDDHARSLAAGERITLPPGEPSICDALMSPFPGEITFPINQPRLAGALTVTDDEVRDAMRFAFRHLKLVVEPGGAVSLAALLAGQVEGSGVTVLMLTGGNVDPHQFAEIITV
ncbi:threonine/serine dehydratase [Brevundimonas sp. 2R-24]|uniref:Threonine/serine dehydratase n=1 Tax=Peiella sedimenti TaxID=3061083 RepID=A0ABT8SH78_9CAUL|nr:threonine/serine dehydratase [Caulobacteraceae bacterium XZ-24]